MADPRSRKVGANDVICLDAEGNWYQGEYPVLHDRTVRFLHKNIAVDGEGNYYLTGEDKPLYFKVEDVPYWVTKIEKTIAGYLITLTDESIELLNFSTLWIGKRKSLYCLVKGGRTPAKFQEGPYGEIAKCFFQRGSKFYVSFSGKKYPVQNSPPKSMAKKSPGPKPTKHKKKRKAHARRTKKRKK